MRELGLCALAHANRHSAYMDVENGAWGELSVLQAAHAAEILIKARIAQEHPLLIFENFPKASAEELSIEALFEKGRTIEWSELPNRLWVTTGITIPNLERFKKFGKLRNGIQHFSSLPNMNVCNQTLEFVFDVIDPFINQCWGLFAVDYDEDDEAYIYFIPTLINHEIPFLVSKEAAECFKYWDVNWDNVNSSYKDLITQRVQDAL